VGERASKHLQQALECILDICHRPMTTLPLTDPYPRLGGQPGTTSTRRMPQSGQHWTALCLP
jgi:hypothetical protein